MRSISRDRQKYGRSSGHSNRTLAGGTLLGLLLMGIAAPAMAHQGAATAGGFASGLLHPLGGLDHLLAMLAVGLWAGRLGGRRALVLPSCFVAVMLLGACMGVIGLGLWGVEAAIALSLVVLGLCLTAEARPSLVAGGLLVGGFALFHGHAHGTEMSAGTAMVTYFAGFALATALLHAIGIGLARPPLPRLAPRLAGASIALAGLALFL